MKIFKVDDYDWFMATTAGEAVAAAVAHTSNPPEDYYDVRELTAADLDRLAYVGEEPDPDRKGRFREVRRTFREELARQVAAGAKAGFFATTEY